MSELNPIIIAGFGRSGTTWISDIVSKALGGLILFEPDHPLVFKQSREAIYSSEHDIESLRNHLDEILTKQIRNKWLLRNHLPNECSNELINVIWKNSEVIGFKSIRWNHNLIALSYISNRKLIYIIRHPLTVMASLIRRRKFFLEFGWNTHWQLFKERNPFPAIDLEQYDDSEISIKYTAMWTVSNIKALKDLEKLDLPLWAYEDFYHSPFKTTNKMLHFLGHEDANIHPSYLFYPSMSTLKTFHTDSTWSENKCNLPRLFWEKTLSVKSAEGLLNIIRNISSSFPNEAMKFEKLNYLNL